MASYYLWVLLMLLLTLGGITADTVTDVLRLLDDALLSWFDSRDLRILMDDYPKQVLWLQEDFTQWMSLESPSEENIL